MTPDAVAAPRGGPQQLVALSHPRSPAAEAYRTLSTNLRFLRADKPLHTVLFTSTDPDDGKTTTLANLAVTAALGGRPTILVDCDLRRPSLHEVFGLPNDLGVATVLAGEEFSKLPLQASGVPDLQVLTSGPRPPSPADLLSHPATDRLLEALKSCADLVLIDAPPVTTVADASTLAPRVDGVILVVAAMRTRRERALQAKAQLERIGARIVGAILNNARVDRRAFRY